MALGGQVEPRWSLTSSMTWRCLQYRGGFGDFGDCGFGGFAGFGRFGWFWESRVGVNSAGSRVAVVFGIGGFGGCGGFGWLRESQIVLGAEWQSISVMSRTSGYQRKSARVSAAVVALGGFGRAAVVALSGFGRAESCWEPSGS